MERSSPKYLLLLKVVKRAHRLEAKSAGVGDASTIANLAPLFTAFMKAYEKEEVPRNGYSIHGPHVLALSELIAETINLNNRLSELSGSPKQRSEAEQTSAERTFNQLSFSEMNIALNADLKFLKELNYTAPYVYPALALLAAQLQQMNMLVEQLRSHAR
ncbi:hypothetical protein Tcan_07527 [Toxocara canis]|uniref:Uncharacterized protein n=1 Tax=Toxocara canis TaxID=6265 RepID=A0A0B2UUM7_TOXCA|nr:hypothetical protein Tcan_07527 [Toxocara canis]